MHCHITAATAARSLPYACDLSAPEIGSLSATCANVYRDVRERERKDLY